MDLRDQPGRVKWQYEPTPLRAAKGGRRAVTRGWVALTALTALSAFLGVAILAQWIPTFFLRAVSLLTWSALRLAVDGEHRASIGSDALSSRVDTSTMMPGPARRPVLG